MTHYEVICFLHVSSLETSTAAGIQKFDAFEASGLSQAQYTAFVLVAGGLGERLDYPVCLRSSSAVCSFTDPLHIHTSAWVGIAGYQSGAAV